MKIILIFNESQYCNIKIKISFFNILTNDAYTTRNEILKNNIFLKILIRFWNFKMSIILWIEKGD